MTMLTRAVATEATLFRRDLGTLFYVLLFPAMLFALLGLVIPDFTARLPELGGARIVDLYLPVVIGLAVTSVAITSLPTAVATYREKGVLRRFATTPLGAGRLLASQGIVHTVALVVAVLLAVLVGAFVFDVDVLANAPASLLAVVLMAAGVLGIGAVVAAVVPSAKVATGVGLALYFPLLVVAGVWTPGPAMPAVLEQIGQLTPVGAGVQGLQAAFAGSWPSVLEIAVPLGYAVVGGVVGVRMFRWG